MGSQNWSLPPIHRKGVKYIFQCAAKGPLLMLGHLPLFAKTKGELSECKVIRKVIQFWHHTLLLYCLIIYLRCSETFWLLIMAHFNAKVKVNTRVSPTKCFA